MRMPDRTRTSSRPGDLQTEQLGRVDHELNPLASPRILDHVADSSQVSLPGLRVP